MNNLDKLSLNSHKALTLLGCVLNRHFVSDTPDPVALASAYDEISTMLSIAYDFVHDIHSAVNP